MAAGLPKMRKVSCTTCEDSAGCPFTGLDEQAEFHQLVRHQSYSKGEMIFRQGAVTSGCYILCRGKVKLARYASAGRKQIIKFLGAGDLFGESGLWEAQASSVSARALADSVVGWLSLEDFQELLSNDPSVARAIQKRLTQEIEDLRVRLTEQAYHGTRERLVGLLLQLGEKYGCKSERGLVIDLPLTQVEIAEMLGNTPEWVCRKIGALQERGLISCQRGKLVILDEAGLRELVIPPRVSVERFPAS